MLRTGFAMAGGAVVVSVITIVLVLFSGRDLVSTVTEPWASGVGAPNAPGEETQEGYDGTELRLPKASPPPRPAEEPSSSGGLPVETEDWPEPEPGEVEAEAERDRGSALPAGAVMGLSIEAINLRNAPVYDEESDAALDRGVIHIPETPMPWTAGDEKNVYLAGHRLGYEGTAARMIFYRLPDLRTGDRVVLRGRDGKEYLYAVTERFVVNPRVTWPVQPVRGRDMVTLQTCVGPGYAQRLVVRADRVREVSF